MTFELVEINTIRSRIYCVKVLCILTPCGICPLQLGGSGGIHRRQSMTLLVGRGQGWSRFLGEWRYQNPGRKADRWCWGREWDVCASSCQHSDVNTSILLDTPMDRSNRGQDPETLTQVEQLRLPRCLPSVGLLWNVYIELCHTRRVALRL